MLTFFSLHYQGVLVVLSATYLLKKIVLMALSFVLWNKKILKSEARVVMLSTWTIMEKRVASIIKGAVTLGNFLSTCLAILLRHKLHEILPSVTYPATDISSTFPSRLATLQGIFPTLRSLKKNEFQVKPELCSRRKNIYNRFLSHTSFYALAKSSQSTYLEELQYMKKIFRYQMKKKMH